MPEVDIRKQLNLTPLDELAEHINMLIYGPPNAGKTVLASTAEDCPAMSPALHLGFEQGLSSIAWRGKSYNAREIRTIEQLEAVFKILEQDQEKDEPFFKTLILDNGTELQQLDKDTIMRDTKKTARNPDNVDIDVPSPREWGKLGARLRRIIQGFRDLPMHTIWTAWRGEFHDEATGIVTYFPKLQGHLKDEWPGYFDIVGYLNHKDIVVEGRSQYKGFLQVQETARVRAKWRNRPQEVPDVIEEPTMTQIWEFAQLAKKAK